MVLACISQGYSYENYLAITSTGSDLRRTWIASWNGIMEACRRFASLSYWTLRMLLFFPSLVSRPHLSCTFWIDDSVNLALRWVYLGFSQNCFFLPYLARCRITLYRRITSSGHVGR